MSKRDNMKDYIKSLNAHKLENIKEYQKVLLGLSGGALTVSLTFSDRLISENGVLFNSVLILGWACLLITVLLQVWYYKKVIKGSDDLIKQAENNQNEVHNIHAVKIKELDFLNKISSITMFSGLLLISVFFSSNLLLKSNKETTLSKDEEKNKCNCPNMPSVNIENNPVFINNNKTDTNIIKKYYNCKPKPKNPCQ